MDIERKIAVRRPMPHRMYREYRRPFKILLGLADLVTWAYFFGIPFFPGAVPHLSDFSIVITFLIEGLKKGLR